MKSDALTEEDKQRLGRIFLQRGADWCIEPREPNDPWIVKMVSLGVFRRLDSRCGFEKVANTHLKFTELGKLAAETLSQSHTATGGAKKYFVILQDEGCIAEKKGGWSDLSKAEDFLREAALARPKTTLISFVTLLPNDDLTIEDGRFRLMANQIMADQTAAEVARKTSAMAMG
jgi:hypothetical protein